MAVCSNPNCICNKGSNMPPQTGEIDYDLAYADGYQVGFQDGQHEHLEAIEEYKKREALAVATIEALQGELWFKEHGTEPND